MISLKADQKFQAHPLEKISGYATEEVVYELSIGTKIERRNGRYIALFHWIW